MKLCVKGNQGMYYAMMATISIVAGTSEYKGLVMGFAFTVLGLSTTSAEEVH